MFDAIRHNDMAGLPSRLSTAHDVNWSNLDTPNACRMQSHMKYTRPGYRHGYNLQLAMGKIGKNVHQGKIGNEIELNDECNDFEFKKI